MTGAAIGQSLNYGFAGCVSREGKNSPEIEAHIVASDSENILFGKPVVLKSDNTVASPQTETITAANFLGIAVAEVKTNYTYPIPAGTTVANNYYAASEVADIIVTGSVMVEVTGTPTANGTVYVRTALSSSYPNEVIGDITANNDSGNVVALTNAKFKTGRKDSNNITELMMIYPTV